MRFAHFVRRCSGVWMRGAAAFAGCVLGAGCRVKARLWVKYLFWVTVAGGWEAHAGWGSGALQSQALGIAGSCCQPTHAPVYGASWAPLSGQACTFCLMAAATGLHLLLMVGSLIRSRPPLHLHLSICVLQSDIPCVADHVSKLVHVGKATVDKLTDLRQVGFRVGACGAAMGAACAAAESVVGAAMVVVRWWAASNSVVGGVAFVERNPILCPCSARIPQAAVEENIEVDLPDDLMRIERVGQFQQLVELTEASQELKHKVRHAQQLVWIFSITCACRGLAGLLNMCLFEYVLDKHRANRAKFAW